MKRNRRILSLLLAVCLVAALVPAVAAAQDVVPAEYAQDDQIVSFAGKEWILLDSNADEIVLLLKTPEAPIAYNASGLSNAWEGSNAEAWCASDEVRAWFSDLEWNALSAEKVFFLSHDEVVTYWANNSADNLKTENGWWLRYNGESVDGELFGIAVSDAGFVGFPHVATNYGARPAVKIPVSKIAAMVLNENETVWQIILIDDSSSGLTVNDVSFEASTKTVTVSYEGAVADSEIYVVITDSLGKVVSTTSQNADGTPVNVTLSDDLVGRYTVRVFNAVGNVSGAVVEKEFAIEDELGNVTEWNINLGGSISANFNIVLSDAIKADSDAKVAVTINGTTSQALISDLPSGTTTDGTDCVKVTVSMRAPEMNDEITIQIVDGDGNSGGEQTFTIRQYAEAIINGDFDDSTKNLVKHMLNYGAKAQTYFNYNTGNIADVTGISFVDVPAVGDNYKATVATVEGIEFYGASLVLNSNTTLRFYFELNGAKEITDYNFGDLAVYGRTVNGTQMYFADIKDIAPDMLNENYTVSVSVNNAESVDFVSYNPMAYIVRMYHNTDAAPGMQDLMYALYNYHIAAANYGG